MYNSLKRKFQDWKSKDQNWIKNFPKYNILIYNNWIRNYFEYNWIKYVYKEVHNCKCNLLNIIM